MAVETGKGDGISSFRVFWTVEGGIGGGGVGGVGAVLDLSPHVLTVSDAFDCPIIRGADQNTDTFPVSFMDARWTPRERRVFSG